jgi:hypothetical protein
VKGRERYGSFVEALGRQLANGQSLSQDIPEDIQGRNACAELDDEQGPTIV